MEITDVSKGRLTAELKITKDCCNILDMLHGGMSATLIDHLSTLALKSYYLADGKQAPNSVSIELSLSYLSGVKEGESIRVETETVRVGRSVAFLIASIYNVQTNKLAVTGKHTKFLM